MFFIHYLNPFAVFVRYKTDIAVHAISAVVLFVLYQRERSVSEGLLLASYLFLFLPDRLFIIRKTATPFANANIRCFGSVNLA